MTGITICTYMYMVYVPEDFCEISDEQGILTNGTSCIQHSHNCTARLRIYTGLP